MNIVRLSVGQPVTVAVGVILILIAGVLSLGRLPIQLTPNIEDTIVSVTTFWEGASPQEVEQEIIDKQEEKLQGIPGLKVLNSISRQSQGSIRLEFIVGTPKAEALREVSDKLREVPDYPDNVDEPVIEASDSENRDFIAWISLECTDPGLDIRTLGDFAEDRIKPLLERVPGMAEINVLGGREREVQIRFDPVELAVRGLTPAQLASAIGRRNLNVSAGQVPDGKLDVRIRTMGQYSTVEAIENTVVKYTDGVPIFIRDVSTVLETFKEPLTFVRSRGKPVIVMNAQKEIGANVMEVMEGLKAQLARFNEKGGLLETSARRLNLGGDLILTQLYDQTTYIKDTLSLVRNNIWIGGGLAIMVLVLFLRSLRSVGIVALAIPISIVGAVVAMVAMGRSVNVISLAGMAFAVGMVVDNAIVVLENIYRHVEMGKPAAQAAYDGAREVWGAILASTLTTIAVFIPILIIEEEAGQLFRDIALAICAAVGFSMIVAITVIPTTAARILRQKKTKKRTGWVANALSRLIYKMCGSILVRLLVVVLFTSISLAGSYFLMPPADYLPAGNRNLVLGLLITPPGYNLKKQTELALRIEESMRPFFEAGTLDPQSPAYQEAAAQLPAVPTFNMMLGVPGEPVVPPPLENYFLVSFGGIMFQGGISVDPRRVVDVVPLMNYAIRPEVIPGVIGFAFQVPLFQLGGATGAAVKIDLLGPDQEQVTAAAQAVYGEIVGRYGPQSINPDPPNFNIPGPELQIIPDQVQLANVAMTTADLGLAVQTSGDGAIIGEYRIGGESIDLKLISRQAVGNENIAALGDVPIAAPTGQVVPLSTLAALNRVNTTLQINRVNRLRAVTLQFTPPPGLPLEQAVADIDQLLTDLRQNQNIHPNVQTQFAGSASKLKEVRQTLLGDGSLTGTLGSSLLLALIVVYLLMCVLFQSFRYPFVIMFSVPLATLGGFAALSAVSMWSFMDRYTPIQMLDVLTMLGFVILIGVVVNNAILIVHQALNFMRPSADSPPMPPRRAIAESVRTRVRPIFMSTLTSLGGMLPLVLMPGAGSELYRGLGSVVVGGLLVSTIFTLILVPLLMSLVCDPFGVKTQVPSGTSGPDPSGSLTA